MAENYDKALEIFKNLQKNGATDAIPSTPTRQPQKASGMMGDIDSLNEAVFGRYNPETDTSTSNGQKILMETMKQFESGNVSEEVKQRVENNIRNSKIPSAILQSVINNPLIETKIGDTNVDEYMDNLMKNNKNIEASKRINEKLNETSLPKVSLNQQPSVQVSTDYSKLYEMMEQIIDKKFNEYFNKINLNESRQQAAPSIKVIQEVDGSKFLLADTSDNIYECTLIYKGKKKKK